MRQRKKYSNGQPRGGTPKVATNTNPPAGKNPKDYHKQEAAFHGGEMAYEAWAEGGKKGYR
jgi:hypothetical protein